MSRTPKSPAAFGSARTSSIASAPTGVSTPSTVERPIALEDGDRALLDARRLDADDGNARAAESLVEPREEARRLGRLRLGGAHDDDAVDRIGKVAFAHFDDLGLERVPERRFAARCKLATEIAAEVAELVVADVPAELRPSAQGALDRIDPQRQLERAHPGDPPVRVLLDRPARPS